MLRYREQKNLQYINVSVALVRLRRLIVNAFCLAKTIIKWQSFTDPFRTLSLCYTLHLPSFLCKPELPVFTIYNSRKKKSCHQHFVIGYSAFHTNCIHRGILMLPSQPDYSNHTHVYAVKNAYLNAAACIAAFYTGWEEIPPHAALSI